MSDTAYSFIWMSIGLALVPLLARIKGVHLLLALAFAVGIPVSFMLAYLLGFPVASRLFPESSRWIFFPGVLGVLTWIALAFRTTR